MRNAGLDILRLVAVLLVIGRHVHMPDSAGFLFKAWERGGWVGVDLFFVLSGFLVSGLLFREYQRFGAVDIKRFLIRRGFKIYPAFWVFLVVSLVVMAGLGQWPALPQILGEVLFVQNYLGGVWDHTWSLAVEEHFYLGLSILVVWLISAWPERPFQRIPQIFLLVAFVCLMLRILNLVFLQEFSYRRFLFGTHIRIDSLMFGVYLSYLWNFQGLQQRMERIPSSALIAMGLVLLSPAFVFPIESNRWIAVYGVSLFYLGSGLWLLAAIRWETAESDLVKGLASLGAASYSIYLWHLPVAIWGYGVVSKVLGIDNFLLYFFNAVVGACVFGWSLNRLIENPLLRLRDHLFPSQSRAVSAQADRGMSVPQEINLSDGTPQTDSSGAP